MTETFDQIDTLDDAASALEVALGDINRVMSAFRSEIEEVGRASSQTQLQLGNLSAGFSSGLRRAFDGVVLDGVKLSDALGLVAKSMADTVYAAAVNPVAKHFGGLLSDGVNAAIGALVPNANGAAFSQGRVMPFARGGVIDGPTYFPMRGATGLMGEAGPEAIMPLTRGADGRLGVRAQGGGSVNVTMNISTPDAQSFQRSQSQIAAQMGRALGQGRRNS